MEVENALRRFQNMTVEQIAAYFSVRNRQELPQIKALRWSFYRYWLDIYREEFYTQVERVQHKYKSGVKFLLNPLVPTNIKINDIKAFIM